MHRSHYRVLFGLWIVSQLPTPLVMNREKGNRGLSLLTVAFISRCGLSSDTAAFSHVPFATEHAPDKRKMTLIGLRQFF